MRDRERLFFRVAMALSLMVACAPAAFSQADLVRWDIISLAFATPPALNTVNPGGVTFAKALDGTKIKLTGSGTFSASAARLGGSGPVTGGGTWETFSPTGVSTANGNYLVTEALLYEFANYQTPGSLIDNIGNQLQAANGTAVLRIDYSDGSKGVLLVECHGPGAPDGISEGVAATKGFRTYDQVQAPVPNVDENRTIFHRPPVVITTLTLTPASASAGASFSATFAGPSLTSQTYFDLRFRAPGSTVDQEAFNWQRGTSGNHSIPAGSALGTWTITGVRAHQDETDHSGSYTNMSVTITVTQ